MAEFCYRTCRHDVTHNITLHMLAGCLLVGLCFPALKPAGQWVDFIQKRLEVDFASEAFVSAGRLLRRGVRLPARQPQPDAGLPALPAGGGPEGRAPPAPDLRAVLRVRRRHHPRRRQRSAAGRLPLADAPRALHPVARDAPLCRCVLPPARLQGGGRLALLRGPAGVQHLADGAWRASRGGTPVPMPPRKVRRIEPHDLRASGLQFFGAGQGLAAHSGMFACAAHAQPRPQRLRVDRPVRPGQAAADRYRPSPAMPRTPTARNGRTTPWCLSAGIRSGRAWIGWTTPGRSSSCTRRRSRRPAWSTICTRRTASGGRSAWSMRRRSAEGEGQGQGGPAAGRRAGLLARGRPRGAEPSLPRRHRAAGLPGDLLPLQRPADRAGLRCRDVDLPGAARPRRPDAAALRRRPTWSSRGKSQRVRLDDYLRVYEDVTSDANLQVSAVLPPQRCSYIMDMRLFEGFTGEYHGRVKRPSLAYRWRGLAAFRRGVRAGAVPRACATSPTRSVTGSGAARASCR